jgi:hypothetical protein
MTGTTGHVFQSFLHPNSCKSDGYGPTFKVSLCVAYFAENKSFDHFKVPGHYCDVGHHLLVKDALSFVQKSLLSIHVFKQVSVFHRFPCSGPSRAFLCPPRRPPRKINTDSFDFQLNYHNLMLHIYCKVFFLDKNQSAPRIFLDTTIPAIY